MGMATRSIQLGARRSDAVRVIPYKWNDEEHVQNASDLEISDVSWYVATDVSHTSARIEEVKEMFQ